MPTPSTPPPPAPADPPADPLAAAIDDLTGLLDSLRSLAEPTRLAADLVADALTSGHKLLACGNGGSATEAAHMTTEFVVRYVDHRPAYPAIALTTHGGDLTAIVNDYGYDPTFSRQVEAFGQPGDVLIAFSTSGKSPNVRLALETAKERGVKTIAMLGRDGGDTLGLADVDLLVPHTVTARIQEAHLLLIHTICDLVEPRLKA
ncbi:MAG: SIS domain-containing protein [Planctomycetota bacterium]